MSERESITSRRWWQVLLEEPAFARRQGLRLLGLSLVSSLVTGIAAALLYRYVASYLSVGDLPVYFAPEDMAAVDASFLHLRRTLLWGVLGLAALNLLITLLIGTVLVSRLGGPLTNFKRVMARVAGGDLTVDVRLRRGDEFQDLSESMADAVARLQIVVLSVRAHAEALRRLPRAAEDEDLREAIDGLQEAVAYFTTVDVPSQTGR